MAVSSRLMVWQLAMDLAVEVHRLSEQLPTRHRLGLADQLARAASSVPANIAEGNARHYRRDYLHFLVIARGSLAELLTHLELARRLELLSGQDFDHLAQLHERVSRMLTRLIQSLQSGTTK